MAPHGPGGVRGRGEVAEVGVWARGRAGVWGFYMCGGGVGVCGRVRACGGGV